MNDLQIDYFLAVADNLSFTKTAAEKYVSQPAISKQISAMEEELGVQLFHRGHKSLRLTEAGGLFAEFYRKQRQSLILLTEKAKESADEGIILRVGMGSGWSMDGIIPKIHQQLKEREIPVSIIVETYTFQQLSTAVTSNEIDLALTLQTDVPSLPHLMSFRLTSVPCFISYSNDLPLAKKPKLEPMDFQNEPFFSPVADENTYISGIVKSYCEPYGFTPRLRSVRNVESLIVGVRNGLGVAVVDEWTKASLEPNCSFLPVSGMHEIAAVWHRNNVNPGLSPFLEALAAIYYPNGNAPFDI